MSLVTVAQKMDLTFIPCIFYPIELFDRNSNDNQLTLEKRKEGG